jgi:hypothetical protein
LIVAQGGALPFWLVFGRPPFLARLVVFWASVTVLFLCWGAGSMLYAGIRNSAYYFRDDVRFVALSLPLAAIAIQLPLWPLKLYFGWSLVNLDSKPGDEAARPLAIRDYLSGTAIVALAFTLARLAPKRMDDSFWIGWLVFAASVAGTALISVVPAMLLMLRRQRFSTGTAIMFLYAVGAAAVTFVVSSLLQPYNWSQLYNARGLWTLFGGLLVFLAFAAGLSGAMLAARSLGYRLTFASERKP